MYGSVFVNRFIYIDMRNGFPLIKSFRLLRECIFDTDRV